MKLRSHQILGNSHVPSSRSIPSTPVSSSRKSRLKQLFKPKNLFKKKPSSSSSSTKQHQPCPNAGLLHGIPDYVRKSVLRFLLESPPPSPPSPQRDQPSCSPHCIRPPLMGIQALKNKKQHRYPTKRILPTNSIRIRPMTEQPAAIENNKSFEDYQQSSTNNNNNNNNYDMTVLHVNFDDEDENSDDNCMFATKSSTHHKKRIPQWARKNELQVAMCNQLYFHRNPSEIFGGTIDCSPAHLRTVLHSMLPNIQLQDDPNNDFAFSSSSSSSNSNKSILV